MRNIQINNNSDSDTKKLPKQTNTMINSYNTLKSQLSLICKDIESNLQSNNKDRTIQLSKPHLNSISDYTSHNRVLRQMHTSSLLTDKMNSRIQSILSLEKIDLKEDKLFNKKRRLSLLAKENQSLISICHSQFKGLKEKQEQYSNSNSEIDHQMKINKELKHSIRKKNKEYIASNGVIKGQMAQIDLLNKRCEIIRENITYKEKNELRAYCNESISNHDNKSQINNVNKTGSLDTTIDQLRKTLIDLEKFYNTQSIEYNLITKSQSNQIAMVNKEIVVLSQQINELNKVKKIKEFNDKENMRKEQLKQSIKCFQLNKNYSTQNIRRKNMVVKGLRQASMPNKKSIIIDQGNVFQILGKVKASTSHRSIKQNSFKVNFGKVMYSDESSILTLQKDSSHRNANAKEIKMESLRKDIKKAIEKSRMKNQ